MQPRPQPKDPLIPQKEEESEELKRFRQEWRAEVQRKRAAGTESSLSPQAASDSPPSRIVLPSWPSSSQASTSQRAPALEVVNGTTFAALPQSLASAIQSYKLAIQHEQRGELDAALTLYRRAFRLDPNVDRAYSREERLAAIFAQSPPSHVPDGYSVETDSVPDISHRLQKLQVSPAVATVVTGTLAAVLAGFPESSTFGPEDELLPTPLASLPDELLVNIIRGMGFTTIERFARVCRKARVLTLDPAIWKGLVTAIYKPPQISSLDDLLPIIQQHLSDYRRVYIAQPRVRLDGVYIAVCHYIRPGLSENSWVNVTHLITYHRYLRFFPNGQVLSLVANEEHAPEDVIPLLKPTLRMKGLFLGTWHLDGTTVHLGNLIDASGRFALPESHSEMFPDTVAITSSSAAPTTNTTTAALSTSSTLRETVPKPHARYMFVMSLTLRSRPLGRWNRLDMQTYDSVNLETGDGTPVAMKHDRPFWFSRVKSYGAY